MQFPNKLYSYQESTLALIPGVLKELSNGPLSALELYRRMRRLMTDPTDFLSVMDCLYALNAVEVDDEGEVQACSLK